MTGQPSYFWATLSSISLGVSPVTFFKRAVKMSHRLARPACHGSPVGRRICFVPKGELSARSSDRVAPKIGRPGRPSCARRFSCVVASKAADQLICSCQ